MGLPYIKKVMRSLRAHHAKETQPPDRLLAVANDEEDAEIDNPSNPFRNAVFNTVANKIQRLLSINEEVANPTRRAVRPSQCSGIR